MQERITDRDISFEHEARQLSRAYSRSAARWWFFSLLCKLSGFTMGALIIVAPLFFQQVNFNEIIKSSPYIVALFTIIAELAIYKSDSQKSIAQTWLRKCDFFDGLGWKISPPEYSDLLARSPQGLLRAASKRAKGQEKYFSSEQPVGPLRTLENTIESAFFSKHLATSMYRICFYVFILTVVLSIAALVVALQDIGTTDFRLAVTRVVTSLLALLLSLGLVKTIFSYYDFSNKCQRVEEHANRERLTAAVEQIEAVKILQEYHLARGSAPVIPDMLYGLRRTELNLLYDKYRKPRS